MKDYNHKIRDVLKRKNRLGFIYEPSCEIRAFTNTLHITFDCVTETFDMVFCVYVKGGWSTKPPNRKNKLWCLEDLEKMGKRVWHSI